MSENQTQSQSQNCEYKNLVEEYCSSMNEQQILVMSIAKEKLGSSFNIEKSNGFKKWLSKFKN